VAPLKGTPLAGAPGARDHALFEWDGDVVRMVTTDGQLDEQEAPGQASWETVTYRPRFFSRRTRLLASLAWSRRSRRVVFH
jgi:hypothetical protein